MFYNMKEIHVIFSYFNKTKLIETKFKKKYLPLSFLLPSVSRRISGSSHSVAGSGQSSIPV